MKKGELNEQRTDNSTEREEDEALPQPTSYR